LFCKTKNAMQISIKAELLKRIYSSKLFSLDYRQERQLQYEINSEEGFRDDDSISFDLTSYEVPKLKQIYSVLVANAAPTKTCETINRWLEVLKDPMNGEVTSLQSLEKVFKVLLKGLKDKWVFYEKPDGEMCPVLVTKTKYYGRTREDVEHFKVSVAYGYLFTHDEDNQSCYSVNELSFDFYRSIFGEDDDDAVVSFFGSDSDFTGDDNDDDGDKEKKPKKPKKKEAIKLSVALEKQKLFLPTKDLYEKYQAQLKKLMNLYPQNGRQFTVDGSSLSIGRYSYNQKALSMNEDGEKNKVVIDNSVQLKDIKRGKESEGYGIMPLPYHPYLKMYDITKYRNVAVHVDRLDEYEYNDKIVDMLVLPDSYKRLLNALIGGENNFDDIVAGKSGGIIILASGAAGTGKTLTAEVYAEVVKKPLYQIQSSQLGLNPKDIEDNLRAILRRADRWNAVLLIDECDAYVFQRNEDMVQNCVVGVFLRLLEYYKGILFLTTNRHDIIDGAIKSRLTAHVKYGIPTTKDQIKILANLSKRFGIKISEAHQADIIALYPNMVGRDIRNLLKLIKKFYSKEKSEIKLTPDMVTGVSEFIPFVNKGA
jgi:hypothetical protein